MNRFKQSLASILRKLAHVLCGENLAQENSTTDPNQNKINPEARHAAPITRTIVEIPESVLAEYHRNQKEQEADNRKSRCIERATLGAAGIVALVSIWQGCLTRKAINQARISANANVATVRAWLVPVNTYPPPIEALNPSAKFPIKIQNTGQTPAMDLTLTEEFKFWDGSLTQTRDQFGPCPAKGTPHFYGALSKDDPPYTFDQPTLDITLTPDQQKELGRTGMIIVHACLSYRTISGGGLTDYCIVAYGPNTGQGATAPCFPKSLDLR